MKRIAVGADHGGLDLKNAIVAALKEAGHDVVDFGTHTTESMDYPDCLLYTSPSPRDGATSRMPSSA